LRGPGFRPDVVETQESQTQQTISIPELPSGKEKKPKTLTTIDTTTKLEVVMKETVLPYSLHGKYLYIRNN